MTEYRSIAHEGRALYEEKKSEFLGFAFPVTTEEEAIAHVNAIKNQYPDARHHVYAYVLRDQNKSRYTDDGEPSGTAGMPVLDCIRKQDLTDCVVIVVRYFGGTLLGTGGLVRAYTAAASDAIRAGEPVLWRMMQAMELTCTYTDYQKLTKPLAKTVIDGIEYGTEIRIRFHLPIEEVAQISLDFTNLTAGRACIEEKESFFGN